MSQAQGKRQKNEKMTLEKASSVQDETKTRALSKLEIAQMLERAEGELSMSPKDNVLELVSLTGGTDEDLTPLPFSVVHFDSAKTSKNMPALLELDNSEAPSLEEETFLHEGLFSGASSPFGLQKPKKTKYVEEITQPIALIAANAEQSQKTQAAPPSSNSLQNPLLMGMLIGVLAGGVLFMLGCWLLLGFARF